MGVSQQIFVKSHWYQISWISV